MHDYKYTKVQCLKPEDYPQRVLFCENLLVHIQEDQQFLRKIIWTDESKFSREGVVNRKNTHYWAKENPHVTRDSSFQEYFGFNVFCLMMDNKIRYLFYDENLTSRKYLEVLTTFVENFVDNLPLDDYRSCWYQLDGAPAHCTAEVSAEIQRIFEDRWFRRLGPWNWPARSPDLTPLDFYLWGNLKDIVYKTPVYSREELEDRVHRAFQNLNGDELRLTTTQSVNTRIIKCLEVNGQHFEHLLKTN